MPEVFTQQTRRMFCFMKVPKRNAAIRNPARITLELRQSYKGILRTRVRRRYDASKWSVICNSEAWSPTPAALIPGCKGKTKTDYHHHDDNNRPNVRQRSEEYPED